MNSISSQKSIHAIIAAFSFSFTIFFFAPLQVYLTNRMEFPFVFLRVLSYFVSVTLFAFILSLILLVVLPLRAHKKTVTILFILSFLVWFQSNILVWNYGVFDGQGIVWNKYYSQGIIDTSLWLLCIIIGIIKSEFIYKKLRTAGIWLIAVQLVFTLFLMAQVSELPGNEKGWFTEGTKYSLSSRKNVIVLTIDAFQSDVFQEIIDEEPSYIDIFRGFTYFPNAVSGFKSTIPSAILILTGQYYDNSIEIREFIKNAFLSDSLPKVLRKNGFDVELYPYTSGFSVYCDPKVASNFKFLKERVIPTKQIVFIYDIALFRGTPHFIKKYIYHNQRWFLQRIIFHEKNKKLGRFNWSYKSTGEMPLGSLTMGFFNGFSSLGRLNKDRNTFKYIFLPGMHPPLMFNEQLENEFLPFNRAGYKKQAKGILKLLKLFLNKLDNMGVYDNCMILIIGDHGVIGNVYIPKDKLADANQSNSDCVPTLENQALPLILVKPFRSNGKLHFSYAPVSLGDIPQTIFSQLGLIAQTPGISMFAIKESENRTRRYLSYEWREQNIKDSFMPEMTEYIVSGFSWLEKSWHATGRKFKASSSIIYQPGLVWVRIKKLIAEQ